jgi:hypothetical protein
MKKPVSPKTLGSLRTDATEQAYKEKNATRSTDTSCVFCQEKPIKVFDYWQIVPNKFPYDRIAEIHDMIYPIRHTDGNDLTTAELAELTALKQGYLNEQYQIIIESLPRAKSIPRHFHLLLLLLR